MSVRPTTSFLPLPRKDATKRNVVGRTCPAVDWRKLHRREIPSTQLGLDRLQLQRALTAVQNPLRLVTGFQGAEAPSIDPSLGVDVAGFRDGDRRTRGRSEGNDTGEAKLENAHDFVLIEVVSAAVERTRLWRPNYSTKHKKSQECIDKLDFIKYGKGLKGITDNNA